MTRHHPARLAVLGALLLLMAACGGDDDTDGTAARAGTTGAGGEATGLTVETLDYAFQNVPAEIPAGLVRSPWTTAGEVTHEFGLAEIGDATVDEFIADFPAGARGRAVPGVCRRRRGPRRGRARSNADGHLHRDRRQLRGVLFPDR